MRRREFINLLGGVVATWPVAVQAQQRRIGVLVGTSENDPAGQSWAKAFRRQLEELGWNDESKLQIMFRFEGGGGERLQSSASDLVRLSPAVVVVGGQLALDAMRRATETVPIVFVQVSDPVGQGIVASMAHPGGNMTGFTSLEFSTGGKYPELLKEVAPKVDNITVLMDPQNASNAGHFRTMQGTAGSIGVQLSQVSVVDFAETERMIDVFARNVNGGLIVLTSPYTNAHRVAIVALAARYRLPAVYTYRYFVSDGGLMSYGADANDLWRRAALYVDRILKGAKPSDLPVETPTKFELAINLRTAKALGLVIPPSLLATADEVIE
jgi:putative tryptophan/tyrosine transport system substrate-binding protein